MTKSLEVLESLCFRVVFLYFKNVSIEGSICPNINVFNISFTILVFYLYTFHVFVNNTRWPNRKTAVEKH